MQIFVTGMHRSGTSVVARLLNLMGCYFAPEGAGLAANAENPRGFWERRDVVALNDRLLASQGATWRDPFAFVLRDSGRDAINPVVPDLAAMLLELDGHRPWFVKDPRLSLTLPFWRQGAPQAGVVLCWRNPASVAVSMARRAEAGQTDLSLHEAYALWEAYLVAALNTSRGSPRKLIAYETLLADPYGQCDALHGWLLDTMEIPARMLPREEIDDFIDAGFNRSAADDGWRSIDSVAAIVRILRGEESDRPLECSSWCIAQLEGIHQRALRAAMPSTSPAMPRLDSAQKARLEIALAALHRARSADADTRWSVEALRAFIASLGGRDS